MPRHTIDRSDDSRTLPLAGFVVAQCRVDYHLTLLLDGAGGTADLMIERDFTLLHPGVPAIVLRPGGHPRELAPALEVFNLVIDRATAGRHGGLEVVFAGGTILRVEPGDQYEAWALRLSSGAQVIATPGGGLFEV